MNVQSTKLSTVLALAYCRSLRRREAGEEVEPCPLPCKGCLRGAADVSHAAAEYLRQRYGGSSQTAELFDAAFPGPH